MSGEHFSGGKMPHTPITRLPEQLYGDVEKNIVYACTDVTLRNPATGEIFLGYRQNEPQIGPWFVGGRDVYAKGIDENAALQVENDLGIHVDETRFSHIATYSTDFPVASPGREDHGRHTQNAVMLVDLRPDEIKELNKRVENGELRDEYSHGAWYKPSDIADPSSDFPWAIKQLVRDLYVHDLTKATIHEDALKENEVRERVSKDEHQRVLERERVASLMIAYELDNTEAALLAHQGGVKTEYSLEWARQVAEILGDDAGAKLEAILNDNSHGDVSISRELKKLGLPLPETISDNGPVLRTIIKTAALALDYNKENNGALLKRHQGPRV